MLLHGSFYCLYAFLGKGFAYAGVGPLLVGEVLLCLGAVAAVRSKRLLFLSSHPLAWFLTGFTLWQAVCTVPYLGVYGLDTARDAAVWGYSLFAWIVAALLLRVDGSLSEILKRYQRFALVFPVVGVACALLTAYVYVVLPMWPGTDVTVPFTKPGETNVHLAGILAFELTGLGSAGLSWMVMAVVGALGLGSLNRGGLLACLCALATVVLLQPRAKQIATLVATVAIVVVPLSVSDLHVVPSGYMDYQSTLRDISIQQIARNLASALPGSTEQGDLDTTKQWRLAWWNKIVDYTVFGPRFWTGKGYGVNLAIDDDIWKWEGLRSPHNSHLTFLARSGVPGFLLWTALQLTWFALVLSAFLRARTWYLRGWSAFFLWLLAYWTAFIVNASFDVSFEGPQVAIPFWTIFGLGWAGQILFQSDLRRRSTYASLRTADRQDATGSLTQSRVDLPSGLSFERAIG